MTTVKYIIGFILVGCVFCLASLYLFLGADIGTPAFGPIALGLLVVTGLLLPAKLRILSILTLAVILLTLWLSPHYPAYRQLRALRVGMTVHDVDRHLSGLGFKYCVQPDHSLNHHDAENIPSLETGMIHAGRGSYDLYLTFEKGRLTAFLSAD